MLRRSTRRSLFWMVVICYIITAFFLVSFASGYRLKLSPLTVARTGNIQLSFDPSDAELQLDAVVQTKRSPVSIRSVFPGVHTVRITREGFMPFEKIIRVDPLITTFVETISLVRAARVGAHEAPLPAPIISAESVTLHGMTAVRSSLTGRVNFFENDKIKFSLPGTHVLAHTFNKTSVILVHTPFELWSVPTQTKTPILLARFSSPIRAVVAVPKRGLLLVVQSERIRALQLGDPTSDPLLIVSGTDIRDVSVTDEGVLVFTDVINGTRLAQERAL